MGDLFFDHASLGFTGNERIGITRRSDPPLRAGTYFVSIAVFATGVVAEGTLTATVETAAADCHLDATCYPEWSSSASGVALIVFETSEGSYACSGTLLNNRRQDLTPYFLTAAHCVQTEEAARSVTAFWSYQTQTCNGDLPDLRSDIYNNIASVRRLAKFVEPQKGVPPGKVEVRTYLDKITRVTNGSWKTIQTGFRTTWASAASMTSRGWSVASAAQSRKLDLKPCGTAATRWHWSTRSIRFSSSGLPSSRENTSGPSPSARAASRISMARPHRGTLKSHGANPTSSASSREPPQASRRRLPR